MRVTLLGVRSIPKISGIPVQDRIEQKVSGNSFRKFRSTSRGCSLFPKISCSFWHFYHEFCLPTKPQDGRESTLHWMQNDLPLFEPVLDCLSSTKTLGPDFLEICGLVVPNFLWVSFARFAYSGETFQLFSRKI